jgi:hypothetical protein
MKRKPITIRFYTWINQSPVRLALRDGQSITHYKCEETEEGYHDDLVTWWREGDTIFCQHDSSGRDCDGRVSSSRLCVSSGDDLDANIQEEASYPHWTRVNASQRDYAAEAAGY